ncbi:hypothetical protein NEDG_02110 [Nematocida displodere]|uniref:Uncharacterized protein n=1 Tax=Nematocida displodere TaxID=1805483 RepID=A0A177EL49_9MICR|nr:hypothetical protein NEDG_02110 [Nematocida displodere]
MIANVQIKNHPGPKTMAVQTYSTREPSILLGMSLVLLASFGTVLGIDCVSKQPTEKLTCATEQLSGQGVLRDGMCSEKTLGGLEVGAWADWAEEENSNVLDRGVCSPSTAVATETETENDALEESWWEVNAGPTLATHPETLGGEDLNIFGLSNFEVLLHAAVISQQNTVSFIKYTLPNGSKIYVLLG